MWHQTKANRIRHYLLQRQRWALSSGSKNCGCPSSSKTPSCHMPCFSSSSESSVKHLYSACTARYFSRCHACHQQLVRWRAGGLYPGFCHLISFYLALKMAGLASPVLPAGASSSSAASALHQVTCPRRKAFWSINTDLLSTETA